MPILTSESYQKSRFSWQADNSFKNFFSGPVSYDPRQEAISPVWQCSTSWLAQINGLLWSNRSGEWTGPHQMKKFTFVDATTGKRWYQRCYVEGGKLFQKKVKYSYLDFLLLRLSTTPVSLSNHTKNGQFSFSWLWSKPWITRDISSNEISWRLSKSSIHLITYNSRRNWSDTKSDTN